MRDHALHFVTTGRPAIGVATLAGMYKAVYATLDSCDTIRIAILVRTVGFGGTTKVEAQFFHAMGMTYEKK